MRNTLKIPDLLLASSPNGGGLAVLDGELFQTLLSADVTGIALDADRVAWCLQSEGGVVRELRNGQLRTTHVSDKALDLHDIMFVDEEIYLVSTETNEVLRCDSKYNVLERWGVGGEPDSCHINCVAVHEGRLIASIFGRFERHRGYKDRTRGAGQVIDVRTGETLVEGLSQPHSLVSVGAQLFLCNSEEQEVVIYDGFEVSGRVTLPGYTRGLAVSGEYIYVGLSCSRNLEPEGNGGQFETGSIAVLDKMSLGYLGAVPVPWKEIYDLRIVDESHLIHALMAAAWEQERASTRVRISELDEAKAGELAELRAELQQAKATRAEEVAKLRAELQQDRAAKAEALAGLRAELQQRVTLMGQQAVELRNQVESSRERTARRDKQVIRLKGSHAALAALTVKRQRELDEHAGAIAQLEELRGELHQQLSHAQEIKKNLAGRVTDLADVISLRDGKIHEMAELISLRNGKIHEMAELISLRDGRVSELSHHVGKLSKRLDVLEGADGRARDLAIKVQTLEPLVEELQLVKSSRSWRLTRPLRFLARLIRSRGLGDSDRAQLASRFGGSFISRRDAAQAGLPGVSLQPPQPVEVGVSEKPSEEMLEDAPKRPTLAASSAPVKRLPGQVQLEAVQEGLSDVFVWAVIDWHFRTQRPQHLARELTETGRRVFYVSNNLIDSEEPGFRVEPIGDSGRLFQIFLHVAGKPTIYFDPPSETAGKQLRASVAELLNWTRSESVWSLVQHPFWADVARALPNQKLLYDCMDHHGGFENNGSRILKLELELMRKADLLIVSSAWLDEECSAYNESRALIRNAGEYEHFSTRPPEVFRDPSGRRVIGYYGAIAPWFDCDLVNAVAQDNAECLVLLVGGDTCKARERLADCPNVMLTGEVAYDRLPYYLHGFDLCLLPFQVVPLTLATNPVKVYEYLSAGKALVTVDLPEMRQFDDLVMISSDRDAFLGNVKKALDEPSDSPERGRRKEYASTQTWTERVGHLCAEVAALAEPRVSVIVLTYNNLDLTKACLASLERHSDYPNLEVVVVDNASSDGTQDYLCQWAEGHDDRTLILNDENRGFAAGNNQGLQAANGDYLVLLNNDTHVTPGWVRTMTRHLRGDGRIGILGPVTNNIGNEARIDTSYENMEQMLEEAGSYTRSHAGLTFEMPTVAFFCVMMPRSTYQEVGGLDESFGMGFFEDDDYCRRVEQAGLSVVCAEDVFVHHELSASFDQLKATDRKDLFDRNKAIYEKKWGEWAPHRYRNKVGA